MGRGLTIGWSAPTIRYTVMEFVIELKRRYKRCDSAFQWVN